jgi:tetratricopeptide (TPR) repeat protein/predicted Ser/Thr protein kinase
MLSGEIPEEVLEAQRRPASRLGKYVLVQEIGRGGMGRVYRAWDGALGRTVAIKVLLFEEPEDQMRFRREAQLAAQLDHPGIVQVYEAGEADGRPYIAMQFVDGVSLEGMRLPVRSAAEAAREAARAIAYAHERGVIHRDLKPGNLLRSRNSRIRITDFGLAKRAGVRSASGMVVGTPSFMSPEQALGEASRVDARSDVFGLGATLYGLLTGTAPFGGPTVAAVLEAVVNRDPRPLRRLNPDVPRDLETVVLKALEKDPARRYPTAEAFAEDVERFLRGEPVHASRPGLFTRLRKAVARRKGVAAAVLLGLAGIGATAGVLVPRWLRAEANLGRRESEMRDLKELGTLWAKVVLAKQGLHQTAADPAKVAARLREALGEVDRFLVGHAALPQAWYVRARAKHYLDDLDGAERDLRRAIGIAPDFVPGLALLGRVRLEQYQWRLYGDESVRAERRQAAAGLLREAQDLLSKARGGSASMEAWGLVVTREDEVAQILVEAVRAAYVDQDVPRAAALLEKEDREEGAAEFCNWIGLMKGEPEEAKRWQSRAIELMPHWPKPWLDRAEARIRQGDHGAAIEDLDRAIRLDPRRALAWSNRGATKFRKGDLSGALEDLDRALEIEPSELTALVNRGAARAERGDLPGARADLDRAIALNDRIPLAFTNRGVLRQRSGDLPGALEDHERAIALHPGDPGAWSERGYVRQLQRDFARAAEDYGKSLELRAGQPKVHFLRGVCRGALRDAPGAVRDLEQALQLGLDPAARAEAERLLRALRP